METNSQLEIVVVAGAQAGAAMPVTVGASVEIGAERDCDLILRGESVRGQRVRLNVGPSEATIEVLAGQVAVQGRRYPPMSKTVLQRYQALTIGDCSLAFGVVGDPRWAGVTIEAAEPGQTRGQLTRVVPSRKPPSNRLATALVTLLVAVGVGATAFAIRANDKPVKVESLPAGVVHQGSEIDLAGELAQQGFDGVTVGVDGNKQATVEGYVTTAEQKRQLVRYLAERHPDVRSRVSAGEDVAAAVREVYRVNGISADVKFEGAGVVAVATAEQDLGRVERIEKVALRDVANLARINGHNEAPNSGRNLAMMAADARKRIAAIVPGQPAYLVTVDGAHYFQGAILPTGHKIAAIEGQKIVLDMNGQQSELTF